MLLINIIVAIIAIASLVQLANYIDKCKQLNAYIDTLEERKLDLLSENFQLKSHAEFKAKKEVQATITTLTDQRDMYKHRLEQLTGVKQ